MAVPVLVPDASVLLKWVLRSADEADQDRALALKAGWLQGAFDIVVPSLWVYEIGNVLGLKAPATASALLSAMLDLALPEQSCASYAPRILNLMRSHHVTFYDAAYHALAIDCGGTMVTADRRYAHKCASAGHIQALTAWQPPK